MARQDLIDAALSAKGWMEPEEFDLYCQEKGLTPLDFGLTPESEVMNRKVETHGAPSTLDMPISPNQMLVELKTNQELERAIEAKQKGVNQFDLAKGERKS